ncbi:MAG TPA: CARDB domain-containing protein, partial [Methanomassiliicoccales archaeon]|nr:CARDB domain-containing protein [Methanomassiliicoccales archaeon]
SLADNSMLVIDNSTIGSNIMAPTGSNAVLKAYNTTFQTFWPSFGGNARAYLYGVSVPAIRPIEGALAYNFCWVEVLVLDGNRYPIPNAVVQMRYYLNGTLFSTLKTNANGKATFAALCDRIDASNNNFLGNYRINATYWYAGVAYQTTAPLSVSLPPYSEPLIDQVAQRTLSIPGALPDLDPPLYASNSNPYRGDNVTLTTYVSNSGVVAANSVLVRFKDGGVTIADVMVEKIAPGTTATVRAVWQAAYPLGQHNISVIVDPENSIKELNENDNTNWTFVSVRGIAELYISASDVTVVPASPTTNSTASVTLIVHNSGDVAAANVNVSFVDIRPSGSQVLLGYRMISNVPALGGTGSTSLTWVPNIPGNHNLLIKVNVGIPPVNEHTMSDNNVTFPVTVLNYADLTPSGVTFSPATAIYVNDQVSVNAAITNIGQTGAANVIVNFWEGAVGTGTMFDAQMVASIPAGQTVVVTGTWNVLPAAGGKIQTRTISIDVNPAHTIVEINYNNNRLVQTVDVVDNRPDLMFVGGINVTSGSHQVDEAVVGESLVLRITVINDGYTPAMSVKIRFDAIDADSFVTNIGTVSRDVDANQTIEIEMPWVVNVTNGGYTLRCTLDSAFAIEETNEANNAISRDFVINPPEPYITINMDRVWYNPDNEVYVYGRVTNNITADPLVGVKVNITLVVAQGYGSVGDTVTVFTDSDGNYQSSRLIPSNAAPSFYAMEVQVVTGNRTVTQYSVPFEVKPLTTETEIPFWVWILIIVVVLLVIIAFSFYLYKYQLGRLVECGECGALIPESSKKCPKCGVEFETGTAKCSQCGAWIPASSTECPECGAKFVTEPLAEEESEYIRKMREQYEAYANPYREQAKQALGKKYTEAKFQEWWKKQPSYMSFEKWLSKEEDKRKAAGAVFPCPVCGTPNPKGSNICSKCGTVFDKTMVPEAGATAAEPSKPTRRIVKRPAEKKAVPKEEQPSEQPPEEPKNQ